jgi:hydrolyase, tartrate alpha subunit/fumarate domain protein, Fe-S type
MKEIKFKQIEEAVYHAINEAACNLNQFTLDKLRLAKEKEKNKLASSILDDIIKNDEIAAKEMIPMCQDTGIVVVFAKIGYDVHFTCDLYEAINSGVRKAYNDFYLRKSVANPLTRKNTSDNTPAIVHTEFSKGDTLELRIALKGAGSENMSRLKMLNPTDGIEGISDFVIETVKLAGGRPCPPIFVGIGIGGDFEKSALLAKEAILEENANPDLEIKELEDRILKKINSLNIGPMGLGGDTSAFQVFIKTAPCHIASLPVAVNIQCHANRHVKVVL